MNYVLIINLNSYYYTSISMSKRRRRRSFSQKLNSNAETVKYQQTELENSSLLTRPASEFVRFSHGLFFSSGIWFHSYNLSHTVSVSASASLMAASPFAAISLTFFLFSFLALAQSSTIGVSYISRILEIQDRERARPSVQIAAAYGVLRRLLPSHSSSFEFGIVSKVSVPASFGSIQLTSTTILLVNYLFRFIIVYILYKTWMLWELMNQINKIKTC